MSRPVVSGARSHRSHRSHPVPVQPDPVLAFACATLGAGGVVGSASRLLAPQLRGHVTTRTLASLEGRGFRIHRIGQAAYVHGAGHHLIFAVWDRGQVLPVFAPRLGHISAGYRRRVERLARETRPFHGTPALVEAADHPGVSLGSRSPHLGGGSRAPGNGPQPRTPRPRGPGLDGRAMNVSIGWQRTLIDPPVLALGGCWRCGRRGPVVAGYYCGGGRSKAPWRPVCADCDAAILENPDGDPFAAGLQYWRAGRLMVLGAQTADPADPGAAR
jgi:hypothetical protein